MFIAIYADRRHLPWLIGVFGLALLIGVGLLAA